MALKDPNLLATRLQIEQCPIRARRFCVRMRDELCRGDVIPSEQLEHEAKDRGVLSQQRKGLINRLVEEDARRRQQQDRPQG